MIRIVAVGKIKEKALSQLIAEYVKRLSAFTRVEIIEVADEHAPQSNSDAENELVKEREGERVLSRIKEGEYVILLDLWGKMEGEIYVKDTVSIKSTSVINGNLHVRKLQVEIGAQINGSCQMITEQEYDEKVARLTESKKAPEAVPTR